MGFEPTTLRDLVGCSNHLSYSSRPQINIMLLLFHLQYT